MSSTKPYYDAEFEVRFILENGGTVDFFGQKLTIPNEARFARLDDVATYIEKVGEHLGIADLPTVVQRRGETKAHYSPWERAIHIPCNTGWALREIVVLHELAHHLTRDESESHGPRFCSCLVMLVTRCIGYEAGLLLAAAFGERGIQITPFVVQ